MNKEKYLQIFKYLYEFSKLRNNSVRDIETSPTQYPEVIWLADIPEDPLISCVTQDSFDKEHSDYWIKVYKPTQPLKPTFPLPSVPLVHWIDASSLLNEDSGPVLKQQTSINGDLFIIDDFPEIKVMFDKYINGIWLEHMIGYKEQLSIYEKEYLAYQKIATIYQKLFNLYNKTQQFGEEFELVIGTGLMFFKASENNPQIRRHAFISKVDIVFETSNRDSFVAVTVSAENTIQIETDSIIDLNSVFDPSVVVDAENKALELLKVKEVLDNPFNVNALDAIQLFSDRIHSQSQFTNSNTCPNLMPDHPSIFFAPALMLRKRNTRSFTALYEAIIKDIDASDASLNIPSLNDLVDGLNQDQNEQDDGPNDGSSRVQGMPDIIYFPKKYNDEQIEIIQKASGNKKVLVQGPPGTGKSHTIANLICHLLANGKKILVTAYSKRALEVLKDKLPDEYKSLTVNLLSGDSTSIQDLKSSVNAINDELSRADLNVYKKEISHNEEKLTLIRKHKATTYNDLVAVKEKAVRKQEINSKYTGTLIEIAERLEREQVQYNWYKDVFHDIESLGYVKELKDFIRLKDLFDKADKHVLNCSIPSPDSLPPSEVLHKLRALCEQSVNHQENNRASELVRTSDYQYLSETLGALYRIIAQLDQSQLSCISRIVNECKSLETWEDRVNKTKGFLTKHPNDVLVIRYRSMSISYPSDINLIHLKNDAQHLLNYLKEGNRLEGISFNLKKAFLPQNTKEKLYFIEAVKVNNSPCDTLDEFVSVLDDIEIQQDFYELENTWLGLLPNYQATEGYSKRSSYIEKLANDVEAAVFLVKECMQCIDDVVCSSSIRPDILSLTKNEVQRYISLAEFSNLKDQEAELRKVLLEASNYLLKDDLHPIAGDISGAINELSLDLYDKYLSDLLELIEQKRLVNQYYELEKKLLEIFPVLVSDILSSNFNVENLTHLEGAIYHRHALNQVQYLLSDYIEEKLSNQLAELDNYEFSCIKTLGSKKAWHQVLETLSSNRKLRQHLDAWVLAVRNIGKTGIGPRALKFRKEAQVQMDYCKDSVPCWIMPLYKVAETVYPRRGMYDYVIIDEASQLGPDAIFLLYLSKNIIIVGDDKQTSPEYVGVNATIMDPFIHRHLTGIPFANFYGISTSFFDHAKLFCEGMIVLREHFRCMPEIIEFSNKYFYAPDGKSLYPLKQYSESRLEPLKHVFCKSGFVEGRSQLICNLVEAEEIASTISVLIKDSKYANKSFGVITLQGTQQAVIIEGLLLKKIGEAEYLKRNILCGNSTSFQGDERDIIFLSLVTAHNHQRAALTKREDEQRFNVAVSRAREQVWLFHSIQIEDLSNTEDLRYKILDHFLNYKENRRVNYKKIDRHLGSQPEPFESWFEVDVHNDIVDKGFAVIPQYEVVKGKYRIDLVILLSNGTKIAIECDGDKWHGPEQAYADIAREKFLTRIEGWQFFRVRGAEYYSSRQKSLEPLWILLEKNSKNHENSEEYDSNTKHEKSGKNTDYHYNESTSYTNGAYSDTDDNVDEEFIDDPNPENQPNKGISDKDAYDSGVVAEEVQSNDKDPLSGVNTSRLNDIKFIVNKANELFAPSKEKLDKTPSIPKQKLLWDIDSESSNNNLPEDANVWFALSHWGKENDTLNSTERSIAYNYGKFIKSKREISERLSSAASKIFRHALKMGFSIENDIEKPASQVFRAKNIEITGKTGSQTNGADEVLSKNEIRCAIFAVLRECPNQSATRESIAARILKKHKIDIRGEKRDHFSKKVSRVLSSLEGSKEIQKYKSKNLRVRLLSEAAGTTLSDI